MKTLVRLRGWGVKMGPEKEGGLSVKFLIKFRGKPPSQYYLNDLTVAQKRGFQGKIAFERAATGPAVYQWVGEISRRKESSGNQKV